MIFQRGTRLLCEYFHPYAFIAQSGFTDVDSLHDRCPSFSSGDFPWAGGGAGLTLTSVSQEHTAELEVQT